MIKINIEEDGQEKRSIIIGDAQHKALNHVVIDAVDWILPRITNNAKRNCRLSRESNGIKHDPDCDVNYPNCMDNIRGGPLMQKVIKCQIRMLEDGLQILKADPAIDNATFENASPEEVINMIADHRAYQTRKQRDQEAGLL